MVVHDAVADRGAPEFESERERLERRKRARGSKRRLSTDGSSKRAKRVERGVPTIYSVLVKVIFVMLHLRPAPSDDAFNAVAAWTDGRRLAENDVVDLEDLFQVIDRHLDHLFHPWVREVDIYDLADDYLDVPFLVETVTRLAHDFAMNTDDLAERKSITLALSQLHAHLKIPPPSRRTTI